MLSAKARARRARLACAILVNSVDTTFGALYPDTHHDPSCIAYSRVARDTLRKIGLKADVVPVRLRVATPPAAAHLVAGREDLAVLGGGTIVRVGGAGRVPDGRWDGHLVVQVEDHWLLDLTLQQVQRPSQGIRVGPSVFELPAPLREHGEVASFWTPEGVLIWYARDEHLLSYRDARAWSDPAWLAKPLANSLAQALRLNNANARIRLG